MSDFDPTSVTVNKAIDCRGSACPGPLMDAKKAMGSIPIKGILEVLSNDPSTKADLPGWAAKMGHECLGVVADEGFDHIFIRRQR